MGQVENQKIDWETRNADIMRADCALIGVCRCGSRVFCFSSCARPEKRIYRCSGCGLMHSVLRDRYGEDWCFVGRAKVGT
jgi:hypothetical protein